MRLIPLFCGMLTLLSCYPANAGQKRVTYYLDGTRVEQESPAAKGYLECALPESFRPGSLRVKPLGDARVLRVELVPADQDTRRAREIARLEERRGELQDRMRTLSRREEIFSAALKSQSGKTPRKTKASPDALGSLQQGTEFAAAQLDLVFRSERKCRSALDALERELATAKKGFPLARVWLSGGRARFSYLLGELRWTPCYDLRFSGDGRGELLLHARLPQPEKGVSYLVSQGTIGQGMAAQAVAGDYPTLSRYPLTLKSDTRLEKAPLTFRFAPVAAGLPAGEAAAFWRGEYLGNGRFLEGEAAEFSLDR
jgi:hypothetical protein